MKGVLVEAEWAPRENYPLSGYEKENHIAYRGNMVWKNSSLNVVNDLPMPEISPSQVLIEISACGICGTDRNIIIKDQDGYINFSSQCKFPQVLGHQIVGKIIEKGKDVNGFILGEIVCLEGIQWCGKCASCKKGDFNHCLNRRQIGLDIEYSGGYAEFISVEAKYCYSLKSLHQNYSNISDIIDLGALIEPIAGVYEGMFSYGGFLPGQNVAVFGAGMSGIAAIQLARASGAAKIIAVEPNKFRRNMAKLMGADYIIDPFDQPDFVGEMILDYTNGQGIAMGIDASGSPSLSIQQMEKGLEVGGRIVIISMVAEYPRIDIMSYVRNKNFIFGTYGHAGHNNFVHVVNLIATKRMNLLPFITGRIGLNDIGAELANETREKQGAIIYKKI